MINKVPRSFVYTILTLLVAFVYIVFFSTSRIESTLPVKPLMGMESNGYSIYENTQSEGITALGQLFSPPLATPQMFEIGFLFSKFDFSNDVKVQVRLSEWLGDRPAAVELWKSNPKNIPSDFKIGLIDFNISHIQLDPEKKYIAWVTLCNLRNELDARIGIKNRGPSTRKLQPGVSIDELKPEDWYFPYPEGKRVLFKQPNPNGEINIMTDLPWEESKPGHNLHFRMKFENRARNISDLFLSFYES